jgi:hypothetical protein
MQHQMDQQKGSNHRTVHTFMKNCVEAASLKSLQNAVKLIPPSRTDTYVPYCRSFTIGYPNKKKMCHREKRLYTE